MAGISARERGDRWSLQRLLIGMLVLASVAAAGWRMRERVLLGADVDLRALEGRADAMRKMPKPTFRAPSALPDYLGMRVRSHSSSRRAIAWSKACIRQCTGTIGWVLIAGPTDRLCIT